MRIHRLLKDDKGVLDKLVETLKELDKNPCTCIPEINHFPNFGYELSAEGFSPRWIIESMTERYMYTQQSVRDNFNALKLFSSLRIDHTEQYVYQYTFTNAMAFDTDVHILCHLYFLISRCGLGKELVVMELMKMMVEKYQINTESESMTGHHAEVITLSRIAHSYPSIMLNVFSGDVDSTALFFFTQFPDLGMLPKMIFSPMIISLLPSLNDFPFAMVIAVSLLLENYSGFRTRIPLREIYLNLKYPRSGVFSECFKCELCLKWGIVHLENGRYRFSPSFEFFRETAKSLIIKMRGQDPDLELLYAIL